MVTATVPLATNSKEKSNSASTFGEFLGFREEMTFDISQLTP